MFKSIQYCRGVAALMVVLFHLGAALSADRYFGARIFGVPFHFGDSGVAFFFVLSGFIIAWVHGRDVDRPGRFAAYAFKRALRIYPPYWIVFAGVYLLAIASPSLRSTVLLDPGTLLKSLLLVPQSSAVVGGIGAPVIIVAWSLQYEVVFYAVMGLFILSRTLGLLAVAAIGANWCACLWGTCSFPRDFAANNFLFLFIFGVLIAAIARSRTKIDRPLWIGLLGAGTFVVAAIIDELTQADFVLLDRRLVFGFASSILILGLVRAEGAGMIRPRSAFLALLGDASYSLYLVHFPLISALCKLVVALGLTGVLGATVAFPVILASCLLVAMALHLYVEKPLLAWLSQPVRDRAAAQ